MPLVELVGSTGDVGASLFSEPSTGSSCGRAGEGERLVHLVRVGFGPQVALEEQKEEVELVGRHVDVRRQRVASTTQVEEELGGPVHEFGDELEIVQGNGPRDVGWVDEACADEFDGRGGDAHQVVEADGDRVNLTDLSEVDPAVVGSNAPVTFDEVAEPTSLVWRPS